MKIDLYDELISLNEDFKKINKKLYVVGGYVRDFLLNNVKSQDIDVCSSLKPSDFLTNNIVTCGQVEIVNSLTGTIHIKIGNKTIEHTTLRIDLYRDGGHNPFKVYFTDKLSDDAMRRDFTCNSIYYDIQEDKIIDYFNGVQDIQNKIINEVVSPGYSLLYDGVRIMRMVRLACSLNFQIDEQTFEYAKDNINNLDKITPKLLIDELKKIIQSDFKRGIDILNKLDAFPHIFRSTNQLPINDNLTTSMQKELNFLTIDTPQEKRFIFFLLDLINNCFSDCYDEYATLEGFARYILDEPVNIGKKAKKDIISALALFDEFNKCAPDEQKVLLLDNIESIDFILEICKTNDKFLEIQKLYYDLKEKNIALTLKDFCIKSADLIEIGFEKKNISTALIDIFVYSVVNEINDRESLLYLLKYHWREE